MGFSMNGSDFYPIKLPDTFRFGIDDLGFLIFDLGLNFEPVVSGKIKIYRLFEIRFLSAGWRIGMTISYVV